jgi:hypothetical protein
MTDFDTKLRAARTLGCKLWLCRQEVQQRFDQGLYKDVIQVLDEPTKEAMARALLKQVTEEGSE